MTYGIRKLNARVHVRNVKFKTESHSLKNYDRGSFLSDLRSIDWEMAMSCASDDPNKMASSFYDLFLTALDVHAPLKRRTTKTRHAPAPWISPNIKNLMCERDRIKRKAERNPALWPRYKQLRNRVTSQLKKAAASYYSNMIDDNSNNPKGMWKIINKVLDKHSNHSPPSSIIHEGQRVEKPAEIAEAFNRHFTSIGPKLAENIETKDFDDPLKYLPSEGLPVETSFEFQRVDPKLIENEINKLKCSKAAGHDKIPVKLVKDAADILSKPLAAIFNSSLESGVFPNIWKIARVTSVFKTGSKTDLNNYRPISILSVFSKLIEKIAHDQFSTFLKEKSMLSKCQHAFRKLHNTLSSLLNVTDSWFLNADKRKINISIFLDLKKAFDTVDHKILLSKLSKYGIRGTPHQWFTSYLTDRIQYCQINGSSSQQKKVQCGIPQGSCLGPLLFILYVNDFEQCLQKSSTNMYADDTSITCSAKDIEELCNDLKTEGKNIAEWMRQNKLSLNTNKTEYMVIGHKRRINHIQGEINVEINGEKIQRAHEVKYLGVTIDENLSWNKQYKKLKCKLKSGLSSLRKLKNILPQSKLDQVYRALFESHLRYGDELWGSLSTTKLEHLQRLQDRAQTLIESAKFEDGWICKWLSVSSLIKYDRAIMTYKIMNGLCPDSLRGRFITRSEISGYSTRNMLDIDIPRQNLEFSKGSFFHSGAKTWNEIPINIRINPTISMFKRNLKGFLQS